ncbi:uncharacterized protein LOC108915637 [Anoplophora glabripennis]|uniref:Uncharacterized protein n=1 Tax=Anoplophora glabripennis TaxID=217634 RepID=V5GPL1_ANOGL|nr:uncharacterized protein LOC108915637 [Anoplophora glabripennis]
MVVPVERISSPHKIKKYVGNDLNLSILNNKRMIIVAGNNCKIKLSENSGLIKVVGDYCDITVLKGSGTIEYIGNYGKIKLGQDISEDIVTYIGNEGEISTNKSSLDESKTKNKTSTNALQSESKINSRKNRIDICNVSKIRCSTHLLPNTIQIAIPSIRISKNIKIEHENR